MLCGWLLLRGRRRSRRLVVVPTRPVDSAELEPHEFLARRGVVEAALDLVARFDGSDARRRARQDQVALL